MSQKAISVNVNVGGPVASLDLHELQSLLDEGWKIDDMLETDIGPILVILDSPEEK